MKNRPYFLLTVIIILLGSSLFTIQNKQFYNKECITLKTNCDQSLRFISYLNSKDNLNDLSLTTEELSHMKDVKKLYNTLNIIFLSVIVLTIVLMFYLLFKNKKEYRIFILDYLFYGSIATLATILVLFIFSFISFDYFFEMFHQIFFLSGNYSFDSNSVLITLFPQEFFIDALKQIILLSSLISLFFLLSGTFLKIKKYDKI